MIEQDIMNGHNVIVIDPKLDNELLREHINHVSKLIE